MLRRFHIAVCAIAMSSSGAIAQTACPLTYEIFEFAIPHLDLQTCPSDLVRNDAFCRATTGNDAVHVFVFAQQGDQCLLTVKS